MAAATCPYPEREGEPDCLYYMRTGVCGYGPNCRFNHPPSHKQVALLPSTRYDLPQRIGEPECQYYLRTGICKFGASCKFHHPHGKIAVNGAQAEPNFLGLPLRPGERECTYYLRTGSCKYGLACKFHHPQPATLGGLMPLPGSTFYTATGSPVAPVPLSYVAGYPPRAITRTPYVSGPHMQGVPGYMPVIVSSPNGTTVPNWSTYQGTTSLFPSVEGRQASSSYGSAQRETDLASGTKSRPVSSLSVTGTQPETGHTEFGFPERPGQPHCQYYLKTGDCKFGMSCKFHHPKDRIVSASPSTLSVIGLPLRQGQPLCTFYMRYGICKYGPTCKFDHPMNGVSYNSSMASFFDMTAIPYPRRPSPSTILASKSSSEASREISKPQTSSMQSEVQADHDAEEVTSAVASLST